ncbi:c-type cytochrome domain-containing protein [Haloferula chungangensis]|uniref:C-type cytochrome domain-containing protein n=1 Tax=Haloferula chungangensis TaxID=1048331 RepID=A0ABW2L2T3_9BACT
MTEVADAETDGAPESAHAPQPRPSRTYGWFLTAFGLATIIGMFVMPILAGPPKDDQVSQWVTYLGRFHFVVLHLPIGMLLLVILMELGKLFRKDKGSSTLVPMFFTATSAVVAVVIGFLLYQSGDDNSELIRDHMWWGIGFASATVAAFILKNWVDLAGGRGNFFYLLTLLASAGVMGVASHDGGESVHGKGYLRKEEPAEVRELINQIPGAEQLPLEEKIKATEPKEDSKELPETDDEAVASVAPVVAVEDQVIFTDLVQPIFDQKCVSCHGEDKQKGKLRMDNYEVLLAGGKEGDGFEPGNAEDSNIIFRIHLPLDDDEHMPPEDKKQIEPHELAIIEWWINSGASPDAKISEVEMPEVVKAALGNIVPVEEMVAEESAKVEEASREEEVKKLLAVEVEKLRVDFPSALNFESQDSSGLTFTAVSMRKNFTDEELAKLAPVMEGMVSLDLSATKVSDRGVDEIAKATKLKMLRLSETEVTDASLDKLAVLAELESLNLYGTKVTTEGVLKLATLPNLKRLYLWQTQVDEAGAEELRKEMPNCEIVMGL